MLKKTKKTLKSNSGFTILELIVVVAIMGFLVALVAPRLVGVTESSKEPTCKTSQQNLSGVVERMIQEQGMLPDKLISLAPTKEKDGTNSTTVTAGKPLVYTDAKDTSATPQAIIENNWIYNGDDESKRNFFSKSFAEDNHLYVHKLSQKEVDELKKLGITTLIDYNDGSTKSVVSGTNVLMIGSGSSNTTDAAGNLPAATEEKFTNPDLIYRIVLGVGEGNSLIEENMMQSAGTCPTGIQHKHIDYNNYSIVLPRLKSTVARLAVNDRVSMNANGYNSSTTQDATTLTVSGRKFEIEKQQIDSWKLDILCPEGHKWPSSDAVVWVKQ